MSIRVGLNHTTSYHYDRHITLGPQVVRLRPAPHCRTPILAYSLRVEPKTHFINWQQDPFGNYLARLVFPEPTDHLRVEVDVVADMVVINPFDFFLEESADQCPFAYDEQLARDLAPYLEVAERGPLLLKWLASVDRSPLRTVDFLVELNQRLQRDISYVIRMEPGVQTCEETLRLRRGSCRDSAWLLVQIMRHLGLAARFVSGYLVQLTADVKALDGPAGTEIDFTDLHAWAEVYVPGAGWIGLDPTSGLFAGEGHIPLACTPDPSSAASITGCHEECEVEFAYRNSVRRVLEDPRVTKPYTDEQWQAVDALGEAVDADLMAHDVRLTMGGEPTFVSVDDMDGAEWNIAALGPTKRRLAGDLLVRLRNRFAPGGVLHHGQGKWYPGEPLPRWALGCFWRLDGVPVWRTPALLAEESRSDGHDAETARRFVESLARFLGVPAECALPGYEDAVYYAWREGTLPVNVDPLKMDLEAPQERQRLTKLLQNGLGAVVGFALPLRWDPEVEPPGSRLASERPAQPALRAAGGWVSDRWEFRRRDMFLVPGDSPMGFRLPLDSLLWLPPEEREIVFDRCQFEPRPPLGEPRVIVEQRGRAEPRTPPVAPTGRARSALCVEPRDGRLYVFLPPVTHLEHFLELVAAIEATAQELDCPIVLEGYEPPRDHRLRRLLITPDPGVIEVNIHPAASWRELVDNVSVLYEEAHLARLGTEKFMIDGRHTGTGGGNHVTLGGPSPADSPILRRPDLLQSLVTYWQHHPSLSYLFSGLFIGPTCQAPRIDEARHEALHELEIAFQQVPKGEVAQPWLVDRLFRNLLVDITGNTHRAEFCLDKLYSPETATGRLGLVEMRAFEMPPHPRMSLVQQILIRALVARFWAEPYRGELERWSTALHDRFLLPHFLWEDARDVVCDLQRRGYAFDLEWLKPFLEFRFPPLGHIQVAGMDLELRTAAEPWNVLGEEATIGGTSRYVDSSVERLQVCLEGMAGGRYVIACNGRRVPLRATGRTGEYVAGVRYRAWQPPSALHPTIAVHTPLVFDVVDTWNERSVGGCTYHVSHPGGRNSDTFPVNAYAAEARRVARFWPHGHTPGPMSAPPEEASVEFPYTLDLRRAARCIGVA